MTRKIKQTKKTLELLEKKRRLFERFSSRFPVKFKDTRHSFGTDVHLRNVSAEGAKIVSRERLYLNDSVSLEVALPDGKDPMTMRGEVVWAKKQDSEAWDVGLKFYKVVFMNMWRIHKSSQTSPTD